MRVELGGNELRLTPTREQRELLCRREGAHNMRRIRSTHIMVLQQLNQCLQSRLGQQWQAISSARALHIVQQIFSTRPFFNLGSSWSRREELHNCSPLVSDKVVPQVQAKRTVGRRNGRHLQRYTGSNEQGGSNKLQHNGTHKRGTIASAEEEPEKTKQNKTAATARERMEKKRNKIR